MAFTAYEAMPLDQMLNRVRKYHPGDGYLLVEKAWKFAEKAHAGQVRKSGEPYFVHLLNVAYILSTLQAGPQTITAGLLHDTMEDCGVTRKELEEEFDSDVATLVEAVTKIGRLEFKDEKEYQAANHRKILIAMAKDIRVILVKLCDRLHNMRTLQYHTAEKQKKIAQETLDVYAPLAHRLGISEIKNELEDLSFMYLNPEKYYEIARLVENKRSERDEQIRKIIIDIDSILADKHLNFRIFGRSKHLYSIYKKMETKNKRFDEILDLLAIRIVTQTNLNCYEILGYIHASYTPIPGRLKDYIAMPKFNMYQSLHTSVINEQGTIFEIQIRTEEMDEIAERGVAAHWRYKEGKYNAREEQKEIEERLSIFRDIISIKDDEDYNDEQFISTLQKDFFDTNVYVMSPKGRVIDLPQGSTPIDFAYRIHTEVGHNTVGATVNGTLVPLNTVLKTGDVVSIRTVKNTGPSEDWLKFAKTSHARNKIRSYLQRKEMENRAPMIQKGEEMLREELEKRGIDSEWSNPKKLDVIYSQYNLKDYNDFMYALANKAISVSNVAEKINRRITNNEKQVTLTSNSTYVRDEKKRYTSKLGIRVAGIDSIMISLAGCCNPVRGDDIVGFITKGSGIKVHRKDCPNIAKEEARIIDVEWDEDTADTKYEVTLYIEATDRTFLITDLVTVISQHKVLLNAINSTVKEDRVNTVTTMKIVVDNADHLNTVIANLRKVNSVTKVERQVQ